MPDAKEALDQFRRDCWIPQVMDGEGEVASSRFGGRPALRAGEKWPTCGACREKMPLFVQIDLANAPRPDSTPEPLRSGLLQLFYCTSDDCECVDCRAFPKNAVARILPSGEIRALSVAEGGPVFPSNRIAEWTAKADFPNFEEANVHGMQIPDAELDEYYIREYNRGNEIPVPCDKLYGWPKWVQQPYYPLCRACNKRTTYVLQIASHNHVPFMFGDSGVGHVCVCPNHPERASFYWSCC